jgi:hypothetical protein
MGLRIGGHVTAGRTKVFWTFGILGTAIMAFGIWGLFNDSARTHPTQWVRWFVGSALVHDLLIAPLVFAIAVLLVRRISPRYRAIVQGGLIASGVILLTTFPLLRGYGQRPDNPSALPNDYGMGVLVTLGVIWLAVAALALGASVTKDRRRKA